MMTDFKVAPRSAKKIEEKALAWRDALGVADAWAPDMVRLIEVGLPKLIPFALVVRNDAEMEDAEAYTEFNPPHIAVRGSVYDLARKFDGRSRMTFAHELGHLVMHVSDGPRPRATHLIKPCAQFPYYESAEWQANKFASLFLMPEHIVRQFGSIDDLVSSCRVSHQAAKIRFEEVGHIQRGPPACSKELAEELKSSNPHFPKPQLVT